MLKITTDRNYKAAIYLRLSKEDGDFSYSGEKLESDSISNQRLLIMDYLKSHPEIEVVREFCDDGYSGANFDRPQFQKMMEAVRSGQIDCIIVKDLSRFGREYIDAGNYLQKVFPMLGIRFIAINDNYDNAQPGAAENDLVLPFKNLVNDSYCRDISVKVRTNLDVKRRNGQFVGSRIVYGYQRSPEDKNKLIVDPKAAEVVRDIFKSKVNGLSASQIAEMLNEKGVLSPLEYKRSNGSKESTPFQTKSKSEWSAVAVYRILKNEIYTGALLQGKTTTPNHKVKKTVVKDRDEWAVTENAHEAIISANLFQLVQKLMLDDTRTPLGEKGVHLFSGRIFCADCGSPMVRKTYRQKGSKYVYFICEGHKQNKYVCSTHMISEEKVYDVVLKVLQAHIKMVMDMSKALSHIDSFAWENRELKKISAGISIQEEIIERNQRLKMSAYEDYRNLILTNEEYKTFCDEFNKKIHAARSAITKLTDERNGIMCGLSEQQNWLAQFKEFENISKLNRAVVVTLVDRIVIDEEKDISVVLAHGDIFSSIQEFIETLHKEAI